ncbi:MAG TPA: glycosyl hydrolase family 65 protein [Solirubrobacteraceae bacterium]
MAGFGGMRDHGGELSFRPRLPAALTRLKFRLMYRGTSLRVEIDNQHARYSLLDGRSLEIRHHGDPVTVEPGQTVELEIPPAGQPSRAGRIGEGSRTYGRAVTLPTSPAARKVV